VLKLDKCNDVSDPSRQLRRLVFFQNVSFEISSAKEGIASIVIESEILRKIDSIGIPSEGLVNGTGR